MLIRVHMFHNFFNFDTQFCAHKEQQLKSEICCFIIWTTPWKKSLSQYVIYGRPLISFYIVFYKFLDTAQVGHVHGNAQRNKSKKGPP